MGDAGGGSNRKSLLCLMEGRIKDRRGLGRSNGRESGYRRGIGGINGGRNWGRGRDRYWLIEGKPLARGMERVNGKCRIKVEEGVGNGRGNQK